MRVSPGGVALGPSRDNSFGAQLLGFRRRSGAYARRLAGDTTLKSARARA